MAQKLQCPACAKSVRVETEHAGAKVRCPHCKKPFLVPGVAPVQNDDEDWLSLDGDVPKGAAQSPPAETNAQPAAANSAGVAGARSKSKSSGSGSRSSGKKPRSSSPEQPVGDLEGMGSFDPDDPFADLPPVPPPPAVGTTATGSMALGGSAAMSGASDGGVSTEPPKATSVEYEYNYRVRCKVCESPTDVTADQAGETIQCHDCHSPIVVPPAPKVKKKMKVDLESAATFAFSDPAVEPRPADPFMKSARELLDSAEQEEEEEPPETYETPQVGVWFADVFGVFKNPAVVMYTIVFTLVLGGVALAIGFFGKIPTLWALLAVSALLAYGLVIAHAFTVMEAIANGEDDIDDWPEILDPGAWIVPLVYCVGAALLVSAPASLLGGALFGSGLAQVFLFMLSIFALFPFVLLSMLDMQTMFAPFSPEVARSVTRSKDAWGGFYFSSAALLGVMYLSFVTLSMSESVIGLVAIAAVLVVGTFLYFAMLGRLAFSIGQVINETSLEDDLEHTGRETTEQAT